MSTYMPKSGEVDRKWYVIDAAGKPLGRVAAQAAVLLRGKHKPTFAPHVDCGDHVIIINCAQAVLTGKKLEKKFHYHHTGYIGHMKAVRYDTLMAQKPTMAMQLAVKGLSLIHILPVWADPRRSAAPRRFYGRNARPRGSRRWLSPLKSTMRSWRPRNWKYWSPSGRRTPSRATNARRIRRRAG